MSSAKDGKQQCHAGLSHGAAVSHRCLQNWHEVFKVPVKVLSGRGVLGAWISRVGFRVYHKFWGLGVLEAGPDK